jgi:hypothetical protein
MAGIWTRHPITSRRTMTRGAAETSSFSGGTAAVMGCDSETSSSTMRMRIALGTSSSSYITFIANWSDKIGSSWRRWLNSPDEDMARV